MLATSFLNTMAIQVAVGCIHHHISSSLKTTAVLFDRKQQTLNKSIYPINLQSVKYLSNTQVIFNIIIFDSYQHASSYTLSTQWVKSSAKCDVQSHFLREVNFFYSKQIFYENILFSFELCASHFKQRSQCKLFSRHIF